MTDILPRNFDVLEERVRELYDVLPKLTFVKAPHRELICTKCKQLMIRAYKSNSCYHRFCGRCIKAIVQKCELCPEDDSPICNKKVVHEKEEKELEKEISQVMVKCPSGCKGTFTIIDILGHLQQCAYKKTKDSNSTHDTCLVERKWPDDKEHLNETLETMKKQLNQIADCQQLVQKNLERLLLHDPFNINALQKSQDDKMRHFEKSLADIKDEIHYVVNHINSLDRPSSVPKPGNSSRLLPSGELDWKILNYKSVKNHVVPRNCKIRSDNFTTNQGYKFCLELFLNGYNPDCRGFVSMLLKLLPGEMDNDLKWPFIGETVISVLYGGQTAFEKTVPMNIVQSIGKNRSIVCIPKYMSIDKLETDCKCLINDFLEVRVTVKQNN